MLHIAIESNQPVVFTLWIDGFFKEVEGTLHYIDQIKELVHLVDVCDKAYKKTRLVPPVP